jgi:hypothetical protein
MKTIKGITGDKEIEKRFSLPRRVPQSVRVKTYKEIFQGFCNPRQAFSG